MKNNIITKSIFGHTRIINIMIYVTNNFFVSHYLLKDIFLLSHKNLSSTEKQTRKSALLKKLNKSGKTASKFSLTP